MISPISARYHNKMGSAKVIIITNTKEPLSFFEQAKGNIGEDLGQFVRRIDCLLTIDKNFNIFLPEKAVNSVEISTHPWIEPKIHSYNFANPIALSRNETLNYLIKTIIQNMQWNKKKDISDTKQNNEDIPNIPQK